MSFLIIGSSKIVEYHIDTLIAQSAEILGLASSKIKSKNSIKICRKYKIKHFEKWKQMIHSETNARAIIIATKIEFTQKILDECLKTNRKIFVEKPLSYSDKGLDKYAVYSDRIFVLYNRRFYKSVNYIKKYLKNKKELYIDVKTPEQNQAKYIKNGSHIIDLLNYVLESEISKFKILYKEINSKFIKVIFKDNKKNILSVLIYYGAAENTSVNFYLKNNLLELKPIENLNVFSGMAIQKEKNSTKLKKYKPILKININDYDNLKFKPGFYEQSRSMIKLIKYNKVDKKFCTVISAIENIKFMMKIFK